MGRAAQRKKLRRAARASTVSGQPRKCDGCSGCCRVMSIPEIQKPAHQACPHQSAKGCMIYGQHPPSCKTYQCHWLSGRLPLTVDQRPDRLGLIFDNSEKKPFVLDGLPWVAAREVFHGAGKFKRAQAAIQSILAAGYVVVMFSGSRRIFHVPPALDAAVTARIGKERCVQVDGAGKRVK